MFQRLLTRKNKKKTNKNERHKMAEYCEYMWFDSARGHNNAALARSIYEERGKLDKRDKQLAINIVRAILRHRPDVGETEIHIYSLIKIYLLSDHLSLNYLKIYLKKMSVFINSVNSIKK